MNILYKIVPVAVIAGGVWWFSSNRTADDSPDLTDASQTEAAHESAAGASIGNATISVDEDSSDDSTAPSPFAVVENDDVVSATDEAVTDAASAVTDSSEPQLAEEGVSAESAEPAALRAGNPVVVPTSYPVTDAGKYFVPREERGPGNLGGPPPLDFPGGPNDPNKENISTLQPPVAPGQ